VQPRPFAPPVGSLPRVGVDCATGKGEDYHAICGRWGDHCLLLETANTMSPAAILDRVKRVCALLAAAVNARQPQSAAAILARQIHVLVDDDGVGRALVSLLWQQGYGATAVGAGTKASRPDRYPRRRDELWFACAERARQGGIHVVPAGTLPCLGLRRDDLRRLRQQLMAPAWALDPKGRRQVESKDETKEKLGRSPDDADAFNLSFHEPPAAVAQAIEPARPPQRREGPYWSR